MFVCTTCVCARACVIVVESAYVFVRVDVRVSFGMHVYVDISFEVITIRFVPKVNKVCFPSYIYCYKPRHTLVLTRSITGVIYFKSLMDIYSARTLLQP